MISGCLALYLRLSQDDIDMKTNESKDESGSIHSQRLLLKRYIGEHPDLEQFPVLEFVDDGYTGTNFDRPGFQKMMAMIRSGNVSCILVKDLSRFGRNYLEVGDYLEHIFPFLNVRFIAVNDRYDSNGYIGTTGGIDIAFRNLIYQRYSQDLSEKVKSSMHMKMAKGRYVTHCPYGYMKKSGVKHEMIPDPVTAPIVREIFEAAISGKKTTEIARMLNERQVLTPMEYKNLSRADMHNEAMWSHQAVLRVIKEYKYTGAMVNFKCENRTIRATVQHRRKPEEWTIVENSHPAIVSHEEYEAANASIRKVRPSKHSHRDQRDRVYYCAYCGRRLRKTFGNDEYYSCATQLYRKDTECSQIFWSRTEIEEVVLAAYKAQLQVMDKEYREISPRPQAVLLETCRRRQKTITAELERADSQNLKFYEQFREGIFDKEMFLRKKAELLKRKESLEQELTELQAQEQELIEAQKDMLARREHLAEAKEILHASDDELRERMYDAIDKVTVYSSKELDIAWKLENVFSSVG